MRTRIKVKDLTVNQWDWLQDNLPDGHQFGPDDVRMCVEFELTAEMSPRHAEMPPRAFVALIGNLARLERAQAVLTPDALPDALEEIRNEADPARAAERS
ncbi:Pas45 [Actinoplanes phage phiAsp2]|jgi:hypothetical protein|uniref:Pas45 n=1 Tax=Actinoplanes phage phiAsp2 TaxID=279303 RepID=Q6J7Y6_9CAUD|nr:Pas45 [Actinoplanes phage phiAsp2]AAT36793.1 Pas45 [Actinoplanes phage phiAsp2]